MIVDREAFERAAEYTEKSLAIDDHQPDAYAVLGCLALHQHEHEKAVALGRKAVELGPSIADNLVLLGMILNYSGRADEGIELIEKAMRLSPYYPDFYRWSLGRA